MPFDFCAAAAVVVYSLRSFPQQYLPPLLLLLFPLLLLALLLFPRLLLLRFLHICHYICDTRHDWVTQPTGFATAAAAAALFPATVTPRVYRP